ncbi:DNA cytosine methyltransferase [Flavobacterium gelidilacus]|uniref:DNA cytosine methyltransferase n=1 Tax=Flavobacterium gelidilacus TaxID=206041 RepID=UPI0004013F8D|nr:DNA cytosine methyltransferase [Flavobacterium gelidilacus]
MFNRISEIKDLNTKKFFIEKVMLFNKLVKVFAEKNKISIELFNEKSELVIVKKLKELNIIESEKDLKELEKLLKKDLFDDFIECVKFTIVNKDKLDSSLDKLDFQKRKLLQQSSKEKNKPKIVDFFCGAGGLSLGFAQEGFHTELANDHEGVCIETYKYNHPEIPENKVIQGDIRKIVDHLDNYIENEIDVVIGGPPCQGFSSANQQRVIDDPRNELYKYFIKAVEKIAPKMVVMENVRGMLPYAEQVVEDYQNISITKNGNNYTYKISYKVLVSNDFGVAQKRQRLIFIAIRNDIVKSKKIKPSKLFEEIENAAQKSKKHVLKDALEYIKPLDAPRIKNLTEVDDETTGKKIDNNLFLGNENSYLKLINQNRKIPYVFNHKARYTNDINYEIYRILDQGDDGTNEKIKDIMPYAHRNHVFKDKYFKLVADKPSRTITAHLKMDCHSHIHPFQIRSITPREAARIQSFPDDYVFLGAYLKTYMQIGNAVPPVMARGIAREIKKHLE